MRPCLFVLLTLTAAVSLGSKPAFAKNPLIKGTPANRLGEEVLHDLVSTPLAQALPPYRWEFRLVDYGQVNAYSWGPGKVGVSTALSLVFGSDRGLWAAVLSHEIGHAVILSPNSWPAFQARLREAYRQAGINPMKAEPDPLLPGPGQAASLGGAREKEYEADRIGLLIMAEAGYHPGFYIQMERDFQVMLGEPPRQVRFLLKHPRWGDRTALTEAAYDAALAVFKSRWPDASRSPGGNLPPPASISAIAVSFDAHEHSLVLHVPVTIAKRDDPADEPDPLALRVVAVFLDGRAFITSADPKYRAPNGWLTLNAYLSESPGQSREVLLRLPLETVPPSCRKLRAVVFLQEGDRTLARAVKNIEVKGR